MKNLFLIILLFITVKVSSGQTGCEIINYSSEIKVNKNKLIIQKSFIIQINDADSDWVSDIEIPYQEKDKLEILEASITDLMGETIRKLKKKEIIDRNDISRGAFFEDSWVKEFNLKWNQYPYRIKYKYRRTKNNFISITNWHPTIYTKIRTNKASLKITIPSDYRLRINDSKEFEYNLTEIEGKKIHYWESKDISPIKKEWFSPPLENLIPSVKIIPDEFNYDIQGSFESWVTYGEWLEQLNIDLDILTAKEKIKVNKLIEGLDDKKEIIRVLYHYMQDNTRYINVSIDIGGLKPYPASYVCENKYGDCKALTIYMKALLKHAGIASYYSIIYAGNNPIKVQREIPSHQFNHVILSIPLERDTIWLENTNKYAPFNYLGTSTQDRYALQVNSDKTKLIKTKALSENDVVVTNKYQFSLNTEGNGKLILSKNMKGRAFEYYQYIKNEYTEKDQKQEFEDDLPLKNYVIESWQFDQKNRDSLNLKLLMNISVKNQLRKIGDMIVLKPVREGLFDFEKPEDRENPIRINYPIVQKDSIVYDLAFINEFQAELPDNIDIQSEYGSYSESFSRVNNQLIVKRRFSLKKGQYSLDTYPDIYNFTKEIKDSQKKSVIILNQL